MTHTVLIKHVFVLKNAEAFGCVRIGFLGIKAKSLLSVPKKKLKKLLESKRQNGVQQTQKGLKRFGVNQIINLNVWNIESGGGQKIGRGLTKMSVSFIDKTKPAFS